MLSNHHPSNYVTRCCQTIIPVTMESNVKPSPHTVTMASRYSQIITLVTMASQCRQTVAPFTKASKCSQTVSPAVEPSWHPIKLRYFTAYIYRFSLTAGEVEWCRSGYHTLHFFSGFILLPTGHLKASAKSSEFCSAPITLCRGETERNFKS